MRPARSAAWATAVVVVLGVLVGSAASATAEEGFHPRADQWYFPPWSIEEKVWPFTHGEGVTVADLGSGVNTSLPEVAAAVLPGGDMVGPASDGHADFSDSGVSTSMAQLIAGQGGGRTQLVGVAPMAKILPVVVYHGTISPIDLALTMASGIRFAVDHGAKVINVSIGLAAAAPCPSEVMEAVAYAVRHDVVLVAAAGDAGNTNNALQFPAACPGVLAVGATDTYSRPWINTTARDYVSVAAPGTDEPVVGKDGGSASWSGTGNAAALVSGAAALVRSANPTMPAREVVHRLIATALDVHTPGPDFQTGFGIVRINRALSLSWPVAADSPNPPYERFDEWQRSAASASPDSQPPKRGPGVPGSMLVFVVLALLAAGFAGTGALVGVVWFVVVALRRQTPGG